MKKVASLLLILVLSACAKEDQQTPGVDPRDVFVAAWNCQEDSKENGISGFEMHFNKSSTNSKQMSIENLYNYGFSFAPYAELNVSGDGFTIPTQIIQGNTVKGEGLLLGTNRINMKYTINNGSSVDTVTAELTKK